LLARAQVLGAVRKQRFDGARGFGAQGGGGGVECGFHRIARGTGRPEHMADNLKAGFGTLPDAAQRARMAQAYAAL